MHGLWKTEAMPLLVAITIGGGCFNLTKPGAAEAQPRKTFHRKECKARKSYFVSFVSSW
jgi:hypothetical protein